ncbi:hypothetical protein ANN_23975 [Periplaneta americana]|uniref:Uncharacterized protein n=1 Tax=Periplaneta americana TaxID=6978 RepID=A0ABQ8S1V0_PERAM|nr:hypothetical protein ANN_23975 [Periplaneta americana]
MVGLCEGGNEILSSLKASNYNGPKQQSRITEPLTDGAESKGEAIKLVRREVIREPRECSDSGKKKVWFFGLDPKSQKCVRKWKRDVRTEAAVLTGNCCLPLIIPVQLQKCKRGLGLTTSQRKLDGQGNTTLWKGLSKQTFFEIVKLAGDNAGEMSPGSSTESNPAFAHIELRENTGKNLNQELQLEIMKKGKKEKEKKARKKEDRKNEERKEKKKRKQERRKTGKKKDGRKKNGRKKNEVRMYK